jgi:hypothetical protein
MARGKHKMPRADTRMLTLPPQVAALNLHAAGIDVRAEAHDIAIPPSDDPQPVRGFEARTTDPQALADRLTRCRITPVALESNGVYRIPLFELLEPAALRCCSSTQSRGQKSRGSQK